MNPPASSDPNEGAPKGAFDLDLPKATAGETPLPPPKCPDFPTYVAWLDAERRRLIATDPKLFERLRNRPLADGDRFDLRRFHR